MRKLITIAAIAAAVLVPTSASAGVGATTSTEAWTETTNNFGIDPCTGQLRTGPGVVMGVDRLVETPPDGVHVSTEVSGATTFYVANGPGPWDPQPGAFLGTLTFTGHSYDEFPGPTQGAAGGTAHGVMTYADGTVRKQSSIFHLTFDSDGSPKIFFADFVCSG